MAKPGIETIAESATWLSIVSQLYNGRMAKLLEPHGMTLGQFSILHHIARPKIAGDTRISDIAEAVLVEQPAVTKAIAKFDSMGLVELTSCPLDKRAKLVTATTKAADLLNTIHVNIGPDLFQVFGAVGNTNLKGFLSNLKKLGKYLDENRLS